MLLSSLGVLGTCKETALAPRALCYTSSAVSLSTRRCAIFHLFCVQSGSASSRSFSVITHFDLDIVRLSRLFWQSRLGLPPPLIKTKHQKMKKCECSKTVQPPCSHERLKSWVWSFFLPLLELFRWDQASAGVGLALQLGLPPCCILLAHDLKDGPLLKGQSGLFTWDGFVLLGVIVKECLHEDLIAEDGTKKLEAQKKTMVHNQTYLLPSRRWPYLFWQI